MMIPNWQISPSDFDEAEYLRLYSDIAKGLQDPNWEIKTGYGHWVKYGQAEGRIYPRKKTSVIQAASETLQTIEKPQGNNTTWFILGGLGLLAFWLWKKRKG
jgi:hypothetical protein